MGTADRMAVLNHGVLQQVGSPQALYDQPVNAFVASFVGTMNLIPADRLFPGRSGRLGLRPQALRLSAVEARTAGALGVEGRVDEREFLGAVVRYRVHTPEGPWWVDEVHHPGRALRTVGTAVWVEIDAQQACTLAEGASA